jgi:spore germination protein KA
VVKKMTGLLKKIRNALTYKKPKPAPFEFLEDKNETSRDKNKSSNVDNNNQDKNNGESIQEKSNADKEMRTPVSIEKWNRKGSSNCDDRNENNKNDEKNLKVEDEAAALDIESNIEKIKQLFITSKNTSIFIREFKIARKYKAFIAFISEAVDGKIIDENILRPLMSIENFCDLNEGYPIDYIMSNVISVNRANKETKLDKITLEILRGGTALFVDSCIECIIVDTKNFEKRNIQKPSNETIIKGPQEAFAEDFETNLSLIRRRIKNKDLTVEVVTVGRADHSRCGIVYLDNVANEKIVNEVKIRIKSIDTEFITGAGTIEQLIEDSPWAIFPQVLDTERPDRAASFIMEGKVVIIVEGTPFVGVVPITFFHLLHTSEDYLLRWQYATFLRLVRAFAFFIALYLPGAYVALTLFHQEMIPTELLSTIARARETVPFPKIIEIIFIELSFELIREASIRVPSVIGQTIGIIGALILGQSAVAAGLVSPVLIIIVAITGLGNFALPNYSLALSIRITRFIYIFLGAIAGLYGLVIGTFILGCLSCNIKSFGVPFFTTIAPKTRRNMDVIIRAPIWNLVQDPDMLNTATKNQNKDPRGWVNKNNGDDKND